MRHESLMGRDCTKCSSVDFGLIAGCFIALMPPETYGYFKFKSCSRYLLQYVNKSILLLEDRHHYVCPRSSRTRSTLEEENNFNAFTDSKVNISSIDVSSEKNQYALPELRRFSW